LTTGFFFAGTKAGFALAFPGLLATFAIIKSLVKVLIELDLFNPYVI
jgi:hypothetical protein